MWEPPPADGDLDERVSARLAELGARPWQIELTRAVLLDAIRSPEPATPVDPVEPVEDADG
jgi:hypothetical protein